ncbi:response regulator [Oleidesulfovibrio alaskensis]
MTRRSPRYSGRRILVIEDNRVSRTMLELMLTKAGYETECVADGDAALAGMSGRHFDLLLLDIELPDITGDRLLPRLRACRPEGASVPAVAVTAHHDSDIRRQLTAAGFTAVFSKPLDMPQLIDAIEKLL